MNATSGPMSGKQFAIYDHDSRCWRTWPVTGLWGSIEFSGTVPKTGYMSSGCLYELPTPELHTDVSDCSSLLPTPNTPSGGQGIRDDAEWRGRTPYRPGTRSKIQVHLGAISKLLPTPAAHDSGNTPEDHLRKKPGREVVTSLQVIVDHGLLPTGGRISQPSNDGKQSSVDELQPQQSRDAMDLDSHLFSWNG